MQAQFLWIEFQSVEKMSELKTVNGNLNKLQKMQVYIYIYIYIDR